ncbi:hypothetical protein [Aminobacter ciceronei]|uniref:hypothetical protein n=1 Tax=Aminobacter ciceronei TaxID=150723 RepID=UPI003F6F137D
MMNLLEKKRIASGDSRGPFSTVFEQRRAVEEVTKQSVGLASRIYQKALKSELDKIPDRKTPKKG